jgi:lysophospholipase L1-like esterase
LVGSLASLVLLVSACSSAPQDVAVVGDSITVLVEDRLQRTDQRWAVEATVGATAQQMRPAAERLASTEQDQAVVNLGTNDALLGVATSTTTQQLQAIVDGFADADCVHLVTINTSLPASGVAAGSAAQRLNEWMRSVAEGDERIRLVDWDAEVARSGDLLRPDGIHPNERGRARLVDLMGEAASSC